MGQRLQEITVSVQEVGFDIYRHQSLISSVQSTEEWEEMMQEEMMQEGEDMEE